MILNLPVPKISPIRGHIHFPEGVIPVGSKERAYQVAEYPHPLVGLVASVGDDVDPCGVVRGESNGHGGHAVLNDREQLDVRQMEVVSVTESLNKTSLRILAREIKLT